MPYETPSPGVRQKKPEIVPQQSQRLGRYFAVRRYPTGIAPKGFIVFRHHDREECQAFVDREFEVAPKKPKKKRKKAAKK